MSDTAKTSYTVSSSWGTITVDVIGNGGALQSTFIKGPESDTLESFLLALACEGVDISDTRIAKALESTFDAVDGADLTTASEVLDSIVETIVRCNASEIDAFHAIEDIVIALDDTEWSLSTESNAQKDVM